jgi:hypothetical protein
MRGWLTRTLVAAVLMAAVCLAMPVAGLALSEDRAYEQVSPVYKGGYGVAGIEAVAPNGEDVAFLSGGAFANGLFAQEGFSLYLAKRDPMDGWSTTSLSSPPTFGNAVDFSADLRYALAGGSLEATKSGVPEKGAVYILHRTDMPDTVANWQVAGDLTLELLNGEARQKGLYESASADLCHIVFGRSSEPLLAEAENTNGQLYELAAAPAGSCGERLSRPLRIVAVKNGSGEIEVINRHCPADLGVGEDYGGLTSQEGEQDTFNAISADGGEIFFTTGVEKDCRVYQVFARLGGERTVEVSRPASEAATCGDEVPCPGAAKRANARFMGADEHGTRVFFTTSEALAAEDTDAGRDLYMTELVCPGSESTCMSAAREVRGPVVISKDTAHQGESAEVQGVVRIAPNGEHVYFVALGVLSGANAEGRSPVRGAQNMYVYDTQRKRLAFVADLCSGPIASGGTEDRQCPRSLTGEPEGRNDTALWGKVQEVQSNRDGGVLVFASYARLREDDTDEARDVYRYDASSETLQRVTLGEGGYDADGNDSRFDASITAVGIHPGREVLRQYDMGSLAVSEDGSLVAFTSAEPLSPQATNDRTNVYVWHGGTEGQGSEGEVSLVSGGTALTPDGGVVVSPSGRDVFFITTASLLPQDTDETADIYDARVDGGGFEQVPVARPPCAGDACQGPLTNPAPLLVPGSVSQTPDGNIAVRVDSGSKKKLKKLKRKKKRKVRKRKTGRSTVHVGRGVASGRER